MRVRRPHLGDERAVGRIAHVHQGIGGALDQPAEPDQAPAFMALEPEAGEHGVEVDLAHALTAFLRR